MFLTILNSYRERIWSLLYDECSEYYKGLTKNFRWLVMRKVGRFPLGRVIMRYFSTSPTKSYQVSHKDSYFPNIQVDEIVKNLTYKGLHLGINLPKNIVEEIVEFAKSTACYGNRKSDMGFYYHQKQQAQAKSSNRFVVAYYFNTSLLCPAIKKLQSDPTLLQIAAMYLEAKPIHTGNHLWWSFPLEATYREKSQVGQVFHYDLDDYRFVKFFFYLTDVDISSGCHVCVRGSHKRKKLSHILLSKRETDKNIIDYYGQESLIKISGKAGFGFAENPLCFHKGITPQNKDRLMLQIQFATTDYGMQHDLRNEPELRMITTR